LNPLLHNHLRLINESLDSLSEAVREAREQALDHDAERTQLRRENWRCKKDLAVLKQVQEDYDALSATNQRLSATQDDLLGRLRVVLNAIKGLSAELRAP
jgi:cell shape-determining protein MreC